MIRYIHGSEDSTDLDVFYVFDSMPTFDECKKFCSEDPNENRNIIVINNGKVTDCFIGTVDEVNNGLIDTYSLHKQDFPLIVTERLERDKELKYIRAIRGILSNLSRTHYRPEIKKALNGNWKERLECVKNIDFNTIDFNTLYKRMTGEDILKVIAFQIGQSLGLIENKELYTKSSIAKQYKDLKNFLYRKETDKNILNAYKDVLIDYLEQIKVQEIGERIVYFEDKKKSIELVHEQYIENNRENTR